MLHELYEQANGLRGESFSIFDHTRGVWHQTWVTNRGRLLQIEGALERGRLVLTGSYIDSQGRRARIRGAWWQAPQGVREAAEVSTDGGRTWQPQFDLIFRRHRG